MRHIYKILFLLMAFGAQAQLETAHWKFGQFAGLNFTAGTASVTSGNLYTNEGCASISDKCGNLLFYTDGKMVFTKNNTAMANGNALLGDASSTQSAIIIPKPNNPDIYYIFTTYSLNGVHYSVVDMSLNGGLGAVVAGQKNIPLRLNGVLKGSEKLTAVSNSDNSGYWVVTHYLDRYYAFSVSAAGVNINPVVSHVGVNVPDKVNNKFFYTYAIGQLKVSPDGTKIAAAHFSAIKTEDFNLFPTSYFTPNCAIAFTYGGVLGLYDFDNETGIVSNETVLNALSGERRTYYGVEFSPDSKVLYSSYDAYNFAADCADIYNDYKVKAAIDRYDLTAASIPASENTLYQDTDPTKSLAGSLQLALDGKIYHAMYSSLSYITNPNDYTTSVFHRSGISLSQTTLGLPPFIASLFDPKILINDEFHTDTYCLGTAMVFSYEGCPDAIIGWDFGDGDTSTAIKSTHTYAHTGIYTVTLTITAPDGTIETKTRTVEIQILTPAFNAVPPICSRESLTALPTVSLNGITGTWSPALDNTQTTIYTFTPATGACATGQTLTITVNQPLVPTFNPVAAICSGESLTALPTVSLNGITGTWSPALDNTQTTIYTFTPNTGTCATGQTLTIRVDQPVTPTFNPVAPICSGGSLTALPTVSLNGITGTWSPALDNTQTTIYTFTPNTGTCATGQTLTIRVDQPVTPTFNPVAPICSGESLTALPTVSLNGITGTWSPALDNTQTTIYIFTPATGQCATGQTLTITVNPSLTPTFNTISPICSGSLLPVLPTVSLNGITGTWSPALDNTQTKTYTFTPDAGQCTTATASLRVVVNALIIPVFNFRTHYCQNVAPDVLPNISNNGITGTWSPAVINTSSVGTVVYVFSPAAGQCTTGAVAWNITVTGTERPVFSINTNYCQNAVPDLLPTISNNGIIGSWNHAAIDTSAPGIKTYTFTAEPGTCSVISDQFELTVEIVPVTTPVFELITDYYFIESPQVLPTVSDNGIAGIWHPAVIDTNTSTTSTYRFTPDPDQCAEVFSIAIKVISYPKIFTPNNDGYHDLWNISALEQSNAKISIYDRYGKILTLIKAQDAGWDGTYKGQHLPSDDYWFVLTYLNREGLPQEFRSHFALKR